MDKFEEWLENNFQIEKEHLNNTMAKKFMRKAWNGALEEVQEATQVHDTLGDIVGEVRYLKSEKK